MIPRVTVCECGRELHFDRGDVHCECGRWYNAFGQRLAPPSQWGEETGERFDSKGRYVGGGEDEDEDEDYLVRAFSSPDRPGRAKYEVCPLCGGEGRTVNPAIDGHGLTREDFEEAGPEFEEDYFGGVYDVACPECKGARVVTRERELEYTDEEQDRRTMLAESGEWPV